MTSNDIFLQAVNDAVKEEYLKRVFKAILNNAELESIEPRIGKKLLTSSPIHF